MLISSGVLEFVCTYLAQKFMLKSAKNILNQIKIIKKNFPRYSVMQNQSDLSSRHHAKVLPFFMSMKNNYNSLI